MKEYKKDQVLRAIENLFPAHKVKEIQEFLNLYEAQDERGKSRVLLAVLKLSGGDEKKLVHFLNEAAIDFRDVLMCAEYDKEGKEIPEPYKGIGIE
jgi:hypothetical protein